MDTVMRKIFGILTIEKNIFNVLGVKGIAGKHKIDEIDE